MFNYQLRILAQYYENYAAHNEDWDGVKEGWKAKGGADFVITISDDDRYMLSPEVTEQIISELLKNESNKMVKYELVSYEFADDKPIDLTEKFNPVFSRVMDLLEKDFLRGKS
jgi:hypothetical protein